MSKAASPEDAQPVSSPVLISAARICELTELTDRRIRQIAHEGYYPPPVRGKYQLTPWLRGILRYYREQINKKEDSYASERKLLTRAKRETAEEELAILRSEYAKITDIAPALRNLAAHQRAVLQRKLEIELGPKMANRPYKEIRPLLSAVVDELCEIFRDGTLKFLTEAPDDKE